jgi:hypothetical protein
MARITKVLPTIVARLISKSRMPTGIKYKSNVITSVSVVFAVGANDAISMLVVVLFSMLVFAEPHSNPKPPRGLLPHKEFLKDHHPDHTEYLERINNSIIHVIHKPGLDYMAEHFPFLC